MAPREIIRYTLRVDKLLFRKFRYIADYDGRSANRALERYIKKRVQEFEEEHGKIAMEDLDWRRR